MKSSILMALVIGMSPLIPGGMRRVETKVPDIYRQPTDKAVIDELKRKAEEKRLRKLMAKRSIKSE